MLAKDGFVELLEECNGLEILPAAVAVRYPVAVVPAVIEIEHGGNGVHPQPVDMVFAYPKHCARDEEALHLGLAVVKDPCAPLQMLALARVGVFVAGAAVEFIQTVGVLWEVSGHPVEDNAYAGVVGGVHEVCEVLGCAVAGGRGEIARDLIAPRTVKGILHDGEQLDVGVAHILDIRNEPVRQVTVRERVAVVIKLP